MAPSPRGERPLGRRWEEPWPFGIPTKEIKSDIPVLVQVGEVDPIGGERSSEVLIQDYRKNAAIDDIELFVYHECRHEIYNELNKEAIIGDLVGWVNKRVG